MSLPRLVIATGNAGKARELRAMLAGRVDVETLADHPGIEMPPEVGDTFEANAGAKAEHVAAVLGVAVLADDSGLEVDALGGAPGVRSARYADGTDADRFKKLLTALEAVPDTQRTARFRCAMAFAVPGQPTVLVEGRCEGAISRSPKGTGGFGYDPVFVPNGDSRSMAELSTAQKAAISHRGQALDRMLSALGVYFSLELDRSRS